MKRYYLICLILFFFGATASGGGFQVSDHSARAMGFGGAFVAMADDASSLYANPSAISFMDGTQLSIGTTIMIPDVGFTFASAPGITYKAQSQVIFPPNLSLTHTFPGGIGVGMSACIPYTLRTDWSPDWPAGRVITHSEIRVVFVSPTVSLKLLPVLSVGLSLNVAYARLLMNRRIGFDATGQSDGSQSLDGSGEAAYGIAAGFLFHPNEAWSVGGAYHSRTSNTIENGNVSFSGIPADQLPNFPNSNFSTHVTTPDYVSGGIGIRPAGWLLLSAEAQYVFWDALSSVTLNFADTRVQSNPAIEKSIPLQWKNSLGIRGGIEIALSAIDLRAGYAFDQTPVPDQYMRPSFPDADRRIVSVGIGYAVSEDLHLDFACAFAHSRNRTVTNSLVEYLPGELLNGTTSFSLTTIGINMSYNWD
jgi:long-chain fatty acid transport protein